MGQKDSMTDIHIEIAPTAQASKIMLGGKDISYNVRWLNIEIKPLEHTAITIEMIMAPGQAPIMMQGHMVWEGEEEENKD